MEAFPRSEKAHEEDDGHTGKAGAASDNGLSVVGMLLAAIGGGIGVLSFVAFFGAAILWVRMDQAGLPGNEAVALIPRSVLLSTGANFLVPSLLVAFGFTVVLYLVESTRARHAKRTLRTWEQELKERSKEAKAQRQAAAAAKQKADEAIERAEELESVAKKAAGAESISQQAVDNIEDAAQQANESAEELRRKSEAIAATEAQLIQVEKKVKEERIAVRHSIERYQHNVRIALMLILFIVGAVITFLLFSIHLRLGRIALLGMLVAGLTAVCLSVLSQTKSFGWFALAAFIAVGIFSGFLTYYRTVDDPKVEPTAVLRTKGAPVFGFFVAQTSDRIYVGTRIAGGAVRLDAIPREEVTDLAVADLESVESAEGRARELAVQICRLARQRPAEIGGQVNATASSSSGSESATRSEPCTRSDFRRLSSGLGT